MKNRWKGEDKDLEVWRDTEGIMSKQMKIVYITDTGQRQETTKELILESLEDFDLREPDKTYSLFASLAQRLYKNQELRTRTRKKKC